MSGSFGPSLCSLSSRSSWVAKRFDSVRSVRLGRKKEEGWEEVAPRRVEEEVEEGGWVQVRRRGFDGRSDGMGEGDKGDTKRGKGVVAVGRMSGIEVEVVPSSSKPPNFFPFPFPFPSKVALTTGSAAGVTLVTSHAFFNSFPPEKPVTRRVVPTDKRKTRVYFLEGSRFERRVKGLLLLLDGRGEADVASDGEPGVGSGARGVAIACEEEEERSGKTQNGLRQN